MNEVNKLIELSGLSQKELSVKLKTPESRISEYKRGKHDIKIGKLKSWCDVLGVDIRELF